MKQVKCKSGLMGWQCRLQDNYANYAEFSAYDETYNLANRLGYKKAASAWRANPIVQGSVEPSDFRKVKKGELK